MTDILTEKLLYDIRQLIINLSSDKINSLPILDDFYDGVTITDATGKICYTNSVQQRIDDLSPEMTRGRFVTEVYRVDDGESPTMQCLKNGKPKINLACFYRTHTGKMVNSIHNIFPLFMNGNIFGTIAFIKDFQLAESSLEQMADSEHHVSPQKLSSSSGRIRTGSNKNGTRFSFKDLIGKNPEFLRSLDSAHLASSSPSSVLLYGETGTGKELFAQSIHNASKRKKRNYIAINCAAIPENLLEGILFGTTKGAFTGSMEKTGLFERAHGGTLFLDEINSMPIGLQAKLLRAIQEGKIRRVGALEEIPIDLKIVSAINTDPYIAVESGHIRQDLLYRLGVVVIRIPPLRERMDDLSLLVDHFVEKLNGVLGKNIPGVSNEVLERLKRHHWPGNIRELEHVIEGAMNMVQSDGPIGLQQISFHLHHPLTPPRVGSEMDRDLTTSIAQKTESPRTASAPKEFLPPEQGLADLVTELEQRVIRDSLILTAGNAARAARKLKISPQLLNHKMRKYGIEREDFLP